MVIFFDRSGGRKDVMDVFVSCKNGFSSFKGW